MSIERPYADRASIYAEHRWTYPSEAIEFLIESAGIDPNHDVAEIGSGTGALTEHLVDRVRRLYAVEPDPAMRAQARGHLTRHPTYRSISGSAEQTDLPDACVDTVVVAQALHWFSPARTRREFGRILRPGGTIGVLWTEARPSAVGAATTELLRRYRRPLRAPGATAHEAILPLYLATDECERSVFHWDVEETWDRFVGGLSASASAPGRDDPAYGPFRAGARRIFDAHSESGRIRLELATFAAVGRPRRP